MQTITENLTEDDEDFKIEYSDEKYMPYVHGRNFRPRKISEGEENYTLAAHNSCECKHVDYQIERMTVESKYNHSKCISYSLKLLCQDIHSMDHNSINKAKLKKQFKNQSLWNKYENASHILTNYLDSQKFNIIHDHILLGDHLFASDKEALFRNDVKYLLSVAGEYVPYYFAGIISKQLPIENMDRIHMFQRFDECIIFINEAFDNNHRILVHCAYGVSRSASIVVIWLMVHLGMEYDQAVAYVKKNRSCICVDSFKECIIDYVESRKIKNVVINDS